jgi:hypothetical protein
MAQCSTIDDSSDYSTNLELFVFWKSLIDDMLPQSNWPKGHELKASALITELENRSDLSMTKMSWASGVIIAVKR